jgi:beta-xylosidase
MAQLGPHRLAVDGPRTGGRLGLLATKSSEKEIQMIAYNYNESDNEFDIADEVKLQITGLPDGLYDVEVYSLDRENGNTYREWVRQGSPKTSADADMGVLENTAAMTSGKIFKLSSDQGELNIKLSLPRHSMKLLKLKPAE